MFQASNIKEVSVRELFEGYENEGEVGGVFAYGGKLIVRPIYQRAFIYNAEEQEAVIETILKGLTLGLLYWAKQENGKFEVVDGQQRIMSICQFVANKTSYKEQAFEGLPSDKKEIILNHKLLAHIYDGEESKKLDWFKIINKQGKKLTPQELLNATYAGSFISDAKRHFSKRVGPAYTLANKYVKDLTADRQEYLGLALKWISNADGVSVKQYLMTHQRDTDAKKLWEYFRDVIWWVKDLFPKWRKQMRGVDWGILYNNEEFRNKFCKNDVEELEKRISGLMKDDVIERKSGIYNYVFDGEEKHLKLRIFDEKTRTKVLEKQGGKCKCRKEITLETAEAHHIQAWKDGGETKEDNCEMLCKECHSEITLEQLKR